MEENNMNATNYKIVTVVIWLLTAVVYTFSATGFFIWLVETEPFSITSLVSFAAFYFLGRWGYDLNVSTRQAALVRRFEYWEKHGE